MRRPTVARIRTLRPRKKRPGASGPNAIVGPVMEALRSEGRLYEAAPSQSFHPPPGFGEVAEAFRDGLQPGREGTEVVLPSAAQVFEEGQVGLHFADRILRRPRTTAHPAPGPIRSTTGRLRYLVAAVLALAHEVLFGELVEQRVDRPRRGTPPTHRHPIHFFHDLGSVHGPPFEELKHPYPETAVPLRTPTVRPHNRNTDIDYSIYSFRVDAFRGGTVSLPHRMAKEGENLSLERKVIDADQEQARRERDSPNERKGPTAEGPC